jgi:hypothetical protein
MMAANTHSTTRNHIPQPLLSSKRLENSSSFDSSILTLMVAMRGGGLCIGLDRTTNSEIPPNFNAPP